MPALRVNGYDRAFVERGAGEPLLLVHGTLCDYLHWDRQKEPFGARYCTIAVSLRHCWPENGAAKATISLCNSMLPMSRASSEN